MRWRAVLVVALSALSLAVVAPAMYCTFPTAYTGARVDSSALVPLVKSVDAGSPAARAGLRAGDVIGCINTRDRMVLSSTFQQAAYEPNPLNMCVENRRTVRHLHFTAAIGSKSVPFYGNTVFQSLRLFSYVVFLLVGCWLVIVRPSLMTWLLFGYCFLTIPAAAAYQTLTVWPPAAYAVFVAILSLSTSVGSAALLLFTLLVPDETIPTGWRGRAFWIALAVVAAFLIAHTLRRIFFLGFFIGLDPIVIAGTHTFTIAVIVIVMARLLTLHAGERARFSWAAAAIAIGVITNDLREGLAFGGVYGTLTIIMPLTLMYAIVRRHLIDIRFVISKAVVYGALMTAIFGIIAAVDWATTRFLAELRVALALDAIVAISLGVVMHRLTPILESAVDSVIYRSKHAAEIYLRRLAHTLPRAAREETVDLALVEDPQDELDLVMAALFRRNGAAYTCAASRGWERAGSMVLDRDHGLIRFLKAERSRIYIDDLNGRVASTFADAGAVPTVAVPIFDGDDLGGFTLYGLHRDGTRLDPDEVALLEVLAESAGQAYVRVENARLRSLMAAPLELA